MLNIISMKRPSPFIARFVMALASLVGLFASTYLFYTYISGAPIACGSGSGCDIVRLSKWAWTFGIPRPLLGIAFYVGLFGLLVVRVCTDWQARWLYRLTMLAALVGFVESGFLFLVQWIDIRAFCVWCLTSAVAATVIALFAPFDRVEERQSVAAERELKVYFVSLVVFTPVALIAFALLLKAVAL